MRFSFDGFRAIENRIMQDMLDIREAVLARVGGNYLSGFVLGGVYGRGEDGVFVLGGEERVYNDYDLFVVVPFTSRIRRNWVARQLAGVLSLLIIVAVRWGKG